MIKCAIPSIDFIVCLHWKDKNKIGKLLSFNSGSRNEGDEESDDGGSNCEDDEYSGGCESGSDGGSAGDGEAEEEGEADGEADGEEGGDEEGSNADEDEYYWSSRHFWSTSKDWKVFERLNMKLASELFFSV